MIVLAIGSIGAGAFLIINNRLVDFLAPVVGTPPVLHGFFTVPGETSLALVVVAAVLAWSMYGRVPVPETAPRGNLVTNAARQELYGNAFNESVLMRPGQWLTRLSVFLRQPRRGRARQHDRGDDRRVVGAAAQDPDRFRALLRAVHAYRRRAAGRGLSVGEAVNERLSLADRSGRDPAGGGGDVIKKSSKSRPPLASMIASARNCAKRPCNSPARHDTTTPAPSNSCSIRTPTNGSSSR